MNKNTQNRRDIKAVDAYKTAAATIGTITPGMSLFAITRGQFSMIDAILACLDKIGPAKLSIWTWCVGEYDIQCLERLCRDDRIFSALLIIDIMGQARNPLLLQQWRDYHGPDSVKVVLNHAKIATLQNDQYKLLLRGSFNLNYNTRYEQFDLTEGMSDFDLVKSIENTIPTLTATATYEECMEATESLTRHQIDELKIFEGVKTWAK